MERRHEPQRAPRGIDVLKAGFAALAAMLAGRLDAAIGFGPNRPVPILLRVAAPARRPSIW